MNRAVSIASDRLPLGLRRKHPAGPAHRPCHGPDQVADALLDYHDLGISTFLIRGFDPLVDAIQYGRELLPRTRTLLAERFAQRAAA